MSIYGWINPNFWYQLRFFMPHKLNGKWHFIKRDIGLPYNVPPEIEQRNLHLRFNPPLMGRWYSWLIENGIYRRIIQSIWDHIATRMKPRGNCINDYVGSKRRKIRYAVYQKNKDPYCFMLQQARNLRMRNWRTWGWQVPESQGPGPGLGLLPIHLDYPNKITRMTQDDWTDTGVSCFALKMLPTITLRKYFNELPRPTPLTFGIDYTKEEIFNFVAWGIDPGSKKLEEILKPTDPAAKEKLKELKEIQEYLLPALTPAFEKDYKLKWPYPDDNIYRPTYSRGFTRKYWSRVF